MAGGKSNSRTHNSSLAIRRVIRLMDETTIQASDEAMDASQSLGKTPTSVEPRKGAFDDPAPGQNDKAGQGGTSDDFDCQPINVRDRCFKLLAGIAAIGIQSGEREIRVTGALDQAERLHLLPTVERLF